MRWTVCTARRGDHRSRGTLEGNNESQKKKKRRRERERKKEEKREVFGCVGYQQRRRGDGELFKPDRERPSKTSIGGKNKNEGCICTSSQYHRYTLTIRPVSAMKQGDGLLFTYIMAAQRLRTKS